ncbi:ABC transporter ATP-binding protein [Pseudomonas sp. PSKL.D1]|uniref:ABC transporter ATP-binding protein n=1 Tax=Pseudomonas sp. PSKL.D1 TaxID=3029060 RepID=UPI002380F3B8|nr:ABC transporter ATP-binding protein [Pseudomonas sp. PSKL.D1]WDY55673.1 ABC transporter ATP-binding protein [Pseudomonas sp. PSKL.D1]
MSPIPALSMCQVQVKRGAITVLEAIDLQVGAGEFVCLLGPSGCGKSTLLDLAAGLTLPTTGKVSCLGQPLTGINLQSGYLFQQDALLPWCTALENVTLSLRLQRVEQREANATGMRWLEQVGLADFAHYYPAQLSGGMRKRVALAQVLVHDAPVLLMDEPFAALDAQTRQSAQVLLLNLWEQRRRAVLFVTHDLDEALTLADRIVMLGAAPNARCLASLPIDLPRPRCLSSVRTHPRYQRLYRRLWQMLHPPSSTSTCAALP